MSIGKQRQKKKKKDKTKPTNQKNPTQPTYQQHIHSLDMNQHHKKKITKKEMIPNCWQHSYAQHHINLILTNIVQKSAGLMLLGNKTGEMHAIAYTIKPLLALTQDAQN